MGRMIMALDGEQKSLAAVAAPQGRPATAVPTGTVFDVQRYSIHDGPGIRTVVFLKGCPLRCWWCSNPEGMTRRPQALFLEASCQRCGKCLTVCPEEAVNPDLGPGAPWRIDRGRCTDCGLCVEACPHGGLRLAGREVTAEEVIREVERDRPFYRRSGGGVTLSGGEPLAQPAFAASLLAACHARNIHTTLETCGYAPWEDLERVLPYADLVLLDLKHLDDSVHRRVTGSSNALILKNARAMAQKGTPLILRLPLIPGMNADMGHVDAVGRFAVEIGAAELHLMPFHQLGRDKYRRLDLPYCFGDIPPLETTEEGRALLSAARATLAATGIHTIIGG